MEHFDSVIPGDLLGGRLRQEQPQVELGCLREGFRVREDTNIANQLLSLDFLNGGNRLWRRTALSLWGTEERKSRDTDRAQLVFASFVSFFKQLKQGGGALGGGRAVVVEDCASTGVKGGVLIQNVGFHAEPRSKPAVRTIVADGLAPAVYPVVADLSAPCEYGLALSGVWIDALGHACQRQGVVVHCVLKQLVVLPQGGFPLATGAFGIGIECFPVCGARAFGAGFEFLNGCDLALVYAVHKETWIFPLHDSHALRRAILAARQRRESFSATVQPRGYL